MKIVWLHGAQLSSRASHMVSLSQYAAAKLGSRASHMVSLSQHAAAKGNCDQEVQESHSGRKIGSIFCRAAVCGNGPHQPDGYNASILGCRQAGSQMDYCAILRWLVSCSCPHGRNWCVLFIGVLATPHFPILCCVGVGLERAWQMLWPLLKILFGQMLHEQCLVV